MNFQRHRLLFMSLWIKLKLGRVLMQLHGVMIQMPLPTDFGNVCVCETLIMSVGVQMTQAASRCTDQATLWQCQLCTQTHT